MNSIDDENEIEQAQTFFRRITATDKYELSEGYPNVGALTPYATAVAEAYEQAYAHAQDKDAATRAVGRAFKDFIATDPQFMKLLSNSVPKKTTTAHTQEVVITRDESRMIPLPQTLQFPQEMSRGACDWLDNWTRFSRFWSPRSYEPFHEAC